MRCRAGVRTDWRRHSARFGADISLGASNGFTKPGPTIVFIAGLLLSMAGLGYAAKTLPIGTAYAIWVGIGAAGTVIYGMVTGAESASFAKIALIVGLVGCVVGLKLVSE